MVSLIPLCKMTQKAINFRKLKLSGFTTKVFKIKLWKGMIVTNMNYIKYERNKPVFGNCFPSNIPKFIDIDKTESEPRT